MLVLLVPLALVVVAAILDVRTREIPDSFPIALLIWAVVQWAAGLAPASWPMLLAGLGAGAAIFVVLLLLGGFGGGDAKLLVALGPVLGLPLYVQMLFAGALAGGLLSLVALARGKRELAYAPAIAVGMASVTLWPGAWGQP